jgi:hypothetical protein
MIGEVFETTDLEYAEQVLSSRYGSLKIDGHGHCGGVRLAHAKLSPSIRLDRNSFAMSFDATGAPLSVLVFGHLRSGRLTLRSGGGDRSYQAGDVYLAVQPGHSF